MPPYFPFVSKAFQPLLVVDCHSLAVCALMSTGLAGFKCEAYRCRATPQFARFGRSTQIESGGPLGRFGYFPNRNQSGIHLLLHHVPIDEHLLDVIPGRKVVHRVEEDFFHDRP